MKCNSCGKKLHIGVKVCDNCGSAVNWKKYIQTIAVVSVAALIMAAALVSFVNRDRAANPAEGSEAPTETTGQTAPEIRHTAASTEPVPAVGDIE